MKFRKYQIQIFVVTFFVVATFFLFRSSLARYVYNNIKNSILESQGFYFSSSVLTMNGSDYKVENWDGVNPYILTVDVNNKKNEEVFTNTDIAYNISVSCPKKVICTTSKDNGIIRKNQNVDSYLITVTPTENFLPGEVVKLETKAISVSPYEKTLSAEYIIGVANSKFSYMIEDSVGSKFLKVKLTNSVSYYQVHTVFDSYNIGDHISLSDYKKLSAENQDKCFSAEVTLTFPSDNIFLDMTSRSYLSRIVGSEKKNIIDGYEYVSEFKFYVGANTNTEVLFYKKEVQKNYSYPFGSNNQIVQIKVNTAT